MFVEEINHALHAALQFKSGAREIASEDFARNLELQAQVDTYLVLLLFVAFFRQTQRVSRTDRRWLRFHLFARQCPDAFRDKNLRGRYLETSELAASYTHYLDTLNGMRRLNEIRRFRSLDYGAKRERILALMDSGANIAGSCRSVGTAIPFKDDDLSKEPERHDQWDDVFPANAGQDSATRPRRTARRLSPQFRCRQSGRRCVHQFSTGKYR